MWLARALVVSCFSFPQYSSICVLACVILYLCTVRLLSFSVSIRVCVFVICCFYWPFSHQVYSKQIDTHRHVSIFCHEIKTKNEKRGIELCCTEEPECRASSMWRWIFDANSKGSIHLHICFVHSVLTNRDRMSQFQVCVCRFNWSICHLHTRLCRREVSHPNLFTACSIDVCVFYSRQTVTDLQRKLTVDDPFQHRTETVREILCRRPLWSLDLHQMSSAYWFSTMDQLAYGWFTHMDSHGSEEREKTTPRRPERTVLSIDDTFSLMILDAIVSNK